MVKHLLGVAAALSVTLASFSAMALTVTPSSDPSALVTNILGSGITFSNVSYVGTGTSGGTFSGGQAAIGIDSGILLTSGSVFNAPGPNTSTSATTANGTAGDPALDALIPGYSTHDATSLSFDFTTATGDLYFDYAFASEEYNEYVGTQFNDVFGFFVDGQNIALLPGTTTPVSINNVNLGSNAGSFINNNAGALDTQYDGLTKVLTASVLGLSAGVHTIKLAIADAGDSVLDSGVFIKAGSFSTTPTSGGSVPELDAKAGLSAILLLAMGTLIVTGRRRRSLATGVAA
ncbi:MAG TPA: choice-of-anchor L domain-containing protein [Polyangiaceae bacterium]|nr:choice-of-anchor L domain-containing protein [Polyangiaceae bacterium]